MMQYYSWLCLLLDYFFHHQTLVYVERLNNMNEREKMLNVTFVSENSTLRLLYCHMTNDHIKYKKMRYCCCVFLKNI